MATIILNGVETDTNPLSATDENDKLTVSGGLDGYEAELLAGSDLVQIDQAGEKVEATTIRGGEDDDVLMHLTEDERASYGEAPVGGQPTGSLLAAMGTVDEVSASIEPVMDDEALLEALQNTDEIGLEETSLLLDALSTAAEELHPPRAVAGDDQRHRADSDGTCTVLLDGRGSYDPHDQILSWSWHDERGQELSSTPQLKLRLPVGRHAFELRVVDREGSWTTDSLVVHVEDGSTS